jgi:hypothetical protein
MYLKGSKLNYTRRRKRSNPWRILVLVVLVGIALYFNEIVVPKTPPLFIPTSTPTRSPESFVSETIPQLMPCAAGRWASLAIS